MTESSNDCLTPDQLKTLLDGSLTAPEQTAMQGHVDGCLACQAALERLVAGSESWDAAVGHLRDETPQPDGPVLAEALQQMKKDEFVEAAWQGAAAAANSSTKPLDFLEPSDQPGSIGRLGVYEVSEVVGRGGMGVVLKAFDPSLHRVVAVKVLAPYLAHNPQARKRFIREAQAIAAVCHDHVITIHAIDESAEQPKIVMQFIAGRSLQEKLDADGSLDLKEILRIGMQTASGLAAAHAQGLVHRDVKPSNILLENGIQRVKLTDFGLARAVDDASLTQSGVIAGTPQYMAPEQANGDAVDHRADLFSLGSVMYAMCVGHSPFRASTTMGVLKRVCHDPARPIQELNPDIPDWLCAIIMKLLSKEREARFPTAKSVAEVLEKWLAHVQQPSVVPRPITVDQSSSQQSDRSASARTESSSTTTSYVCPASRSSNDVFASTIFFQPISARWLLFILLAGMTGVFAMARANRVGIEEALLTSVFGGMLVCFWGLLLAALVRFIWANVYRSPQSTASSAGDGVQSTNRGQDGRTHPIWRLPPESLAMLAAFAALLFVNNFLVAVIVAIVVWRVVTYYIRRGELQPDTLVEGETTRVDAAAGTERPTLAARVSSVLQSSAATLGHLGKWIGSFYELELAERRRLVFAAEWFVIGGIDLVGAVLMGTIALGGGSNVVGTMLLAVVWLGMSLFSFAVAQCIVARQNFDHVRGASFLGLLPISPGCFLRIPISLMTMCWLHLPTVKESFATTPWPETDLGRMLVRLPVGHLSQTVRRWLATICRLTLWSVLCFVLFLLTLALYVIPFGPSDYHVYDASAQTVMSKGDGPQFGFSMMATGTGRTCGLLPPSHVYLRDTILLTAKPDHLRVIPNRSQVIPGFQIRLGYPATTNKGGRGTRPFTKEHCQELFQEISGQPHPQHAESLFQTIQWINAARDQVPTAMMTPAERFSSAPSFSVEDGMNQLRRTFLHAEPLYANRPLPGFVAASTLLNKELFEVQPGAAQHVSNSCMTTPWLLISLFIGFPLLWLMGVWRIVRRRHGTRVVKLAEAS